MSDFVLRAGLAGIGLALLVGPLGTIIVWRRMAYFGDTLAHSALLGIGLGFLLGVEPGLGILATGLAMAILLTGLERRRAELSRDTILGILAHGSLSLGLIVIAFQERLRVDLVSYLFGDILAVDTTDLAWIYGGGVVVLGLLALIWRPVLLATISPELAEVEGVKVRRVQLLLALLMAAVVALAMKLIGILLVTSLLIVPAAAARQLARTPEQMAVLAGLIAALAAIGGLQASLLWDLPSGPAIVVAALVLFAGASIWRSTARAR
ncbi:MAG: metal ABC transporter permease [Proteobacteria bacterium]|nr:metal ABC transporter permease [Pseudomonadota bacterium]